MLEDIKTLLKPKYSAHISLLKYYAGPVVVVVQYFVSLSWQPSPLCTSAIL